VNEKRYGVVRIDELDSYPISSQQGLTWRPVRRHFDISSFGVNAYTAEEAGQRVVEEHREQDGHDELYVVLSGRATFTVEGEEYDAPAGTLVHCPPGTLRSVPGEVFKPSGWEWVFAGVSRLDQGDEAGARAELQAGIKANPDAWQGYFNYACNEARLGNEEEALALLERSAELDPEGTARWAREDEDLVSLRDNPRFLAIAGQTDADSAGS